MHQALQAFKDVLVIFVIGAVWAGLPSEMAGALRLQGLDPNPRGVRKVGFIFLAIALVAFVVDAVARWWK